MLQGGILLPVVLGALSVIVRKHPKEVFQKRFILTGLSVLWCSEK